MSAIGQLILSLLPLVPRPVIERFARPYVAGDDIASAVAAVHILEQEGCSATIDVLGEETASKDEAGALVGEYLELLDRISAEGLDANVSVKLSGLGLRFDPTLAEENLKHIVDRAAQTAAKVRIDMEDSSLTDATLEIYRRVYASRPNLGVVVQASLKRSMRDAVQLASEGARVRVVKGIYVEPERIAHRNRRVIREAYLDIIERLVNGGCHVAVATHDRQLLRRTITLLESRGISRECYEFQMLLGVRPKLRKELVDSGQRVRVYVPYGEAWYAYSMRRLRENPAIARHVAGNLFTR